MCQVPISFTDAALGGEVEVPTLKGTEKLTIPAGTQHGEVFKLKGKGLPRLGRSGNGDLQVRVHVWTPEQLSDEQRRLLQELRQLEGEPPRRGSGFWSKLKEALGA